MQNKIFIGNLSFSTTEEKLFELVTPYGEVQDVAIPVNRDSGRSRGFAFVTFVDEESATKALALNEVDVDGRKIRVSLANSEEKREGGGGAGRRPGGGGPGGKRPFSGGSKEGGGRFKKSGGGQPGGGRGRFGGGEYGGGGGYDRDR